ncbi:FAD-dependent pyridine nucleotide-disulfide oxidoreductase [Fibrella aestuarina BUZ 2]|uniref:FAD-dependent pyridine nucleotide-disulfide oxidoreductase n=1 Tax=Fibrella aestuarina BUZ 2 TaxID=1166018 RepID=I0KF00_9BACT|nr:NAD(P)/FAD-dependent oxidoreductase [Fibrella aestuarina]CCH02703.1 FAD-dependent pyridine nucleotide-disulfide oxidoreductase [Fibrella aestuarina BUZ 2]
MTNQQPYDVLIIGGSYAGMSAALVLGRSLRRVLVIDAGQPCNRQTPQSHSFLTRDGETPARLSAMAREQVSHYPTVEVRSGTVTNAEQTPDGFRITTAPTDGGAGESATGRKLLLATGVVDSMPDLPGFAECWGRSVLHCPYCHGYEVHGQPLGILANGEVGYEMATLIQQWSRHLTLFTNGPATFDPAQRQRLDRLQIPIVEKPIAAFDHEAGQLTALRFTDGSLAQPTALFARVPFRQSTDLATQLGCTLTENGLLDVTDFGETNVPGVFAVGDATTPFRQVAIAVANGVKAAAWINRELLTDDLSRLG